MLIKWNNKAYNQDDKYLQIVVDMFTPKFQHNFNSNNNNNLNQLNRKALRRDLNQKSME